MTAWRIPLDPANQERRKSNRETLPGLVDQVDLTNYLKMVLEHTSADLHHWAEAVVEAPSIP